MERTESRKSLGAGPEPVNVLRGHTSPVTCLLSIDDDLLLSGSDHGVIKLWSIEGIREITKEHKAHDQSIQSISRLSKNSIVSSGRDGLALVWDLESNEIIPSFSIFTGCTHFCNSATIVNTDEQTNLICCPSNEEQIVMWDIRESNAHTVAMTFDARPLNIKTGMTMSLVYRATRNNAAHHVIGGYESGDILAFDVRANKHLATVRSHSDPVTALDSSPKDDKIISVGADDVIYQSVLNVNGEDASISTASAIELPSVGGAAVRYRYDGAIAVVGRWDHTVRVFDTKRLKPLATLRVHRESVNAIDFIREGPRKGCFLSGSKDGTIALWDAYADATPPLVSLEH